MTSTALPEAIRSVPLCPLGLFKHLGLDRDLYWLGEDQTLTRADVRQAVENGWRNPSQFSIDPSNPSASWSADDHLARVASIIAGWNVHKQWPLDIDVDESGRGVLTDGHHRLVAAWYLRAPSVQVALRGFQGDERDAFLSEVRRNAAREHALVRRWDGYAAKVLAETMLAEPPRPCNLTDGTLTRLLRHSGMVRPAAVEEFPFIREAIKTMLAEERP